MEHREKAAPEWRGGWPLVVAAALGIVASSVPTYTLGLFMKPLNAAFGWSRAEVSAGMLIWSISCLLFASLAGALIDRFGPRRVALIGAPLTGAALAAVGLTGPEVWTWYAAWCVYAVACIAISTLVWNPAIARHFNRSRGLALALGLCGSGVAASLWPPLAQGLIETFDWRVAFHIIGASVGVVLSFAVWLLFRGPATDRRHKSAPDAEATGLWGVSFREAMGSWVFWRIAVMIVLVSAAVSSVMVHLVALLTDKGMSALQAASIAAAVGPALIVGRLLGGVALDRFPARWVGVACVLLPAIGCVLLIGFDGNPTRALIAACLIGMAGGIESDFLAYVLSRYFGLRSFGAIYGAGMGVFSVGFGMAPMLAGAMFDTLGSYDRGLIILAAMLALCLPLVISLGSYPRK